MAKLAVWLFAWLFIYFIFELKHAFETVHHTKFVYLRFQSMLSIFIFVLPLQQQLRMVPANSDLSMNSDSSPRTVTVCFLFNIPIALIFEHFHYQYLYHEVGFSLTSSHGCFVITGLPFLVQAILTILFRLGSHTKLKKRKEIYTFLTGPLKKLSILAAFLPGFCFHEKPEASECPATQHE